MRNAALRRPVTWILVAAVAAATVLAMSSISLGATKTIKGAGVSWLPAKRTIAVGGRIVWKATSGRHTVTSYRQRSGRRGRKWRKNVVIDQGEATKKRFKRPGVYRFKCIFHEGMTGRVKVIR